VIGFLISVILIAICLFILSKIPPLGIDIDGVVPALIGGAIIGAFNGLWYLFPGWFKATTAVISLGLIPLIGSVIVFGLAAWLVQGFRLRYGLWSAIFGAIALSIVNWFLHLILGSIGLLPA
jgi:putative membrane protein